MKIVFISGRSSGKNPNEISTNTKEITSILAKKNIGAFCPQINTSNNTPYKYWNSVNLEIMRKACHAVLVIPQLEFSENTKDEIKECEQLGLPIFYPESPKEDDLKEIENWYFSKSKNEEDYMPHIISFEEARIAREKIKK